ncbi:MAG: hypothetical protein GX753_05695 [Erysipelothrix sp.]|nr:hypothetical protein [Erysipelothrix sp.]
MPNVVYLTFNEKEPMMASFGMEIKVLNENFDATKLVRELNIQHIEIAYMSNDVYKAQKSFFTDYQGNLTFILFDSNDPTSNLAKRRLKDVLASSIGIQTR